MEIDAAGHGYMVSTEKLLLDRDVIFNFLTTCYWSPGIVRSRVEKGIANAMCFGVYDTSVKRPGRADLPRQVGFARVITDKAVFAYIADVFILEDCRGKGLSNLLMRTILDHPELQGLRRRCLMTRDAQGLYSQFGFAATPDPTRYMELVDRESYKKD